MDDLVHAILTATDHVTVAALYGSAGAGGVMMALAADRVLARDGIVLNPHYKGMGGLYGSEYWTYSLPKRVGAEKAIELTEQCLPISVREAKAIGLIDDIILQDDFGASSFSRFREQIARIAEKFAHSEHFQALLIEKKATRDADEKAKPLEQYRMEELEEMNQNFWGKDRSYHLARAAFVRKQPRPGHLKCYVALESVCANEGCEEAKRASNNRCAFASVGWSAER
jgi:putative two-component system hydrogenase maturation factor HypX/HoxX